MYWTKRSLVRDDIKKSLIAGDEFGYFTEYSTRDDRLLQISPDALLELHVLKDVESAQNYTDALLTLLLAKGWRVKIVECAGTIDEDLKSRVSRGPALKPKEKLKVITELSGFANLATSSLRNEDNFQNDCPNSSKHAYQVATEVADVFDISILGAVKGVKLDDIRKALIGIAPTALRLRKWRRCVQENYGSISQTTVDRAISNSMTDQQMIDVNHPFMNKARFVHTHTHTPFFFFFFLFLNFEVRG